MFVPVSRGKGCSSRYRGQGYIEPSYCPAEVRRGFDGWAEQMGWTVSCGIDCARWLRVRVDGVSVVPRRVWCSRGIPDHCGGRCGDLVFRRPYRLTPRRWSREWG